MNAHEKSEQLVGLNAITNPMLAYTVLESREFVGVGIVLVAIHKGQSVHLAITFCYAMCVCLILKPFSSLHSAHVVSSH